MLGVLRAALPGAAFAQSSGTLVSLWAFDETSGAGGVFDDLGPADAADEHRRELAGSDHRLDRPGRRRHLGLHRRLRLRHDPRRSSGARPERADAQLLL